MRIDWFIMEEDGKRFLEKLSQYKDLDYYRINTIQMIIEYLFNRFRMVILFTIFPIYVCQVIFFSLTLLQYHHHEKLTEEYRKQTIFYATLNLWTNIISLCYNLYVFVKMPRQFFFRLITWNDLIFAAVNITLYSYINADNTFVMIAG
jgi:hypothetical protein